MIKVSNGGTAKANNVYIDIEFSKGLFLYELGEKHDKPKSPIPFNPVVRAKSRYEEQNSARSRLYSQLGIGNKFDQIVSLNSVYDSKLIRPINRRWWTKLDGQKITVKIDNLLHTRRMIFDDEYMIAPLESGKHTIDIRVICEEYDAVDATCIEFEI